MKNSKDMSGNIEKDNWKDSSYKHQRKAFAYVNHLLNSQLSANHVFHNWHHTYSVVQGVQEIIKNMNLSVEDEEVIFLAAWFHDTGHIEKCIEHEEVSKKIAKDFLLKNKYPLEKIAKVLECIDATRIPQSPKDLLGEILCDSDLFHLASSNYLEQLQHLREEWASIFKMNYSERKWLEMNLTFLKSHQYFTKYGQEMLKKGKQKNIELLERLSLKLNKNG